MKKVLEAHKANLKARQARHEAFKMRECAEPRAIRESSPLFEPEQHQMQHDSAATVRASEPVPHRTRISPVSPPVDDVSGVYQPVAPQKRKGT